MRKKTCLRLGLIGLGGIGQLTLRDCLQLDYFEPVAGADPSAEMRCRAAEVLPEQALFADYQEMLRAVPMDAVFIATPNVFHAPAAIAAMQAGCHVLCEKPMAESLAAAKRIYRAAQETGRLFMVAQNQRFRRDATWLKGQIEGGLLGNIYALHTRWLRRRPLTEGKWFRERRLSGGGPLIDLGVHVMDLALWLAGFPAPERVSANAGRYVLDSGDVEDWACAFVRLAGGTTLTCEVMEKGFVPGEVVQVEIRGTKGGVMIDGGEGTTVFLTLDGAPAELRPHLDPDHRGARHRELVNFAEAVLLGKAPLVPLEESLRLQAVLEGVYRSARQGREIVVSDFEP